MRRVTIWRAGLLLLGMALAPGGGLAQTPQAVDYAPTDPVLPLPLYSTNPAAGGLFVAGSYVMYRQSNPLRNQVIAVRGFIATDDTLLGPFTAGTFVGSRNEALNVQQVSGPSGYQPGFQVEGGWKFHDGTVLSVGYLWLSEVSNRAAATLANRDLNFRSDFADSFLTAYVYNFPNEFAGPPNKIGAGTGPPGPGPESAFGIWNGASVMTLSFLQRFQQVEATYRVPIFQTECYRLSGLAGPRFVWIWENFEWRTTDIDSFGNEQPNWSAYYNNIVSNRMYGGHAGFFQEWYLGGGLAFQLDLQAAMFYDSAKEEASYTLGTNALKNKRARRDLVVAGELQGGAGFMWYPTEGIQIQASYNVLTFFNTIASPNPVSFNYGALDPAYVRKARIFDGLQVGIAFIF